MSASPSFMFSFNVGETFLGQAGHPITVPKSEIDYDALESSGIDLSNLSVVFPRGEQYAGQFYELYAGKTEQRGAYRQLRMRGAHRDLPPYLKLGDRLVVLLYKYVSAQRSFVVLEYRD